MKRGLSLALSGVLLLNLVGCVGAAKKNENGVIILPKPAEKSRKLAVAGVDELHRGTVWDSTRDGNTILFSWNEDRQDTNPADEVAPPAYLYTMNLRDQKVTRMNYEMNENYARYSPDGTKIAFTESVEETFAPFMMDNKPNSPAKALKGYQLVSLPLAWSPDSRLLAASYYYLNKGKIVLYDTHGNEKEIISGRDMKKPYFYDDETIMYVTSGAGTKSEIMSQNINSTPDTAQKVAEGIDYLVSPSRQYLAYLSPPGDDGKSVLRIAPISSSLDKGTDAFDISLSTYTNLAWSPDSRVLVYSDAGSIWAVDLQTREKTQLVSDMSMVTSMLWTGNREIIFSGSPKDNIDGYNHIYRIKLK